MNWTCSDCGAQVQTPRSSGLCFRCHVRSISFTFRGAHMGRAGWNEGTVMGEKRAIYDAARAAGTDIERAH